MTRRCLATVSALMLICGSAGAAAQTPAGSVAVPRYRARIIGVYDETSGDPVEGVRIADLLSGSSALTTATGTLSLIFLPDGGSLIRVQKLGYEQQTLTIAISPADTVPITILLRHLVQLPAVVTNADSAPQHRSPALRGFEERRKRESGYFITEEELRKNDGRPLGNLLVAKAPGVIIGHGRGSEMFLMRSPRCAVGGPPQVYLDGVPISAAPLLSARASGRVADAGIPPFNLMDFDVSNLAAVEFYPDGDVVPINFAHTSDRCGALLLWTRER